jgi:NTE family protein
MSNIKMNKNNPFSLVLSGGGALGIAHLGVLADMENMGLKPSHIVGTSMGGIVGASIAVGMDEAQIHHNIAEFARISKWINLSFDGNAIVKTRKIKEIFQQTFGNQKIKETDIPLTIVSADLLSGEKYIFEPDSDDTIIDALLTTMAIPGVFEEQHLREHILADGFLYANLGIDEAMYNDVIAVDVMSVKSLDPELPDSFFKTANVVDMMERSLRLLIINQTRTTLKNSPKNILLIEPQTAEYKTFNFNKVDEIRALGVGLLGKN